MNDEDEKTKIEKRLLKCYKKFKNVFSKKKFDKLSSFRKKVNFKIDLKSEIDLMQDINHESLYKMNDEKLEIIKKYLETNLQKNFIMKSVASFSSLMLIARIENKLRFCVKYQ